MAKRRNQKKEKALRNQAYARKFRKKTSNSRMGGRRRMDGGGRMGDGDGEQENTSQGAEGAED